MTILLLMEIFWVNLIFVGWGLLSQFLLPSLRILTPQECLFWGPGPIDDPINVFLPLKINMPPAKKGSKGDPCHVKRNCFPSIIFQGLRDFGNFEASKRQYTLPETNIAPENWWLEDYFPFGMAYFRGYVSFRGCTKSTLLKWTNQKPHVAIQSVSSVEIWEFVIAWIYPPPSKSEKWRMPY